MTNEEIEEIIKIKKELEDSIEYWEGRKKDIDKELFNIQSKLIAIKVVIENNKLKIWRTNK